MSSFVIDVQSRRVVEALQHASKTLPTHIDHAVYGTAAETGRKMADRAPKAFSNLVTSIKPDRIKLMEWRVGPHVNYAEAVEKGSRGGGFVPFRAVVSWIKVKGITPRNPDYDQDDLAWVIQKKILMKGTPAQPFVQPVADSGFPARRLKQLVEHAAQQSLTEAGL